MLQSKIDLVRDIVIDKVDPDRIILFGSCARGTDNENSDIDLMILKKNFTGRSRDITGDLHVYMSKNRTGIPVDLFVKDYDRFYELSERIGYIYKDIKEEGKIIYERS
jgi:predicted nucleotidyltransferase